MRRWITVIVLVAGSFVLFSANNQLISRLRGFQATIQTDEELDITFRVEKEKSSNDSLVTHVIEHTYTPTRSPTIYSSILREVHGRYALSNVFVWNNVIYYISEDSNFTLPPIICSTVDWPDWFLAHCNIQVVPYSTIVRLQAEYWNQTGQVYRNLTNGLLLMGLNSENNYHIVWEAIIPAFGMMLEVGGLPRNPMEATTYLNQSALSLFFMLDYFGDYNPLVFQWWTALLPGVQFIYPHELSRVETMIVGANGHCAHYGHCSHGSFMPEDSAMVFRDFVSHNFQLTPWKERDTFLSDPNSTCRITLVQRRGSRHLSNFADVAKTIREDDSLGSRHVREVDFEDHSVSEQIRIANSTDIFVLVHGGALLHMTWLPPGAMVVDIYPYEYWTAQHVDIVNWIRYNLSPLHLGHHPIQITSPIGQYLHGSALPHDCLCTSNECGWKLFGHANNVTVDIPTFSKDFKVAVAKWRSQDYQRPLPKSEFLEKSKVDMEELLLTRAKANEERVSKGMSIHPECV